MLTRSQLAVMDFNEGISLEQVTTGQGDKRFNVTFSKVTKQWSAKPIKEKKDLGYLHQMVKETIESAAKNEKFDHLVIPKLSKNIAGVKTLTKLLLLRTKNQDLESEFSFFDCIYFPHLSNSSTKKNDNLYNIQKL